MGEKTQYFAVGLLFLFFIPVQPATAELQCSVPGQCVDSQFIGEVGADDEQGCIKTCKATANCSWYTFDPKPNTCLLLETCSNITTAHCPACVGGQVECSPYVPIQCSIPGICDVSKIILQLDRPGEKLVLFRES